jgi:tartrate-resistant acid phosphatase type 5
MSLLFFITSIALATPTNFPTKAPVRFIIMGDAGTGEDEQYDVANAIEKICAERNCQFAINAGDNIYEYGVSNNKDNQFQEKFEKPFAKLNFPFFMALGNHDESGAIPGSGVHPEKGDFEIQYTQQSKKWMLPKRYYNFAVPFANSKNYNAKSVHPIIEFFTIDTNPLAPQNQPQHEWYKPNQKFDLEQRRWLRQAISESSASWKVVVGHHPYRNNGRHGNSGEYEGLGLATGSELKKMYENEVCEKVDFLMTGHDHSLQWLEPFPSCGTRPQFIISGAAAKTNDSGKAPSSNKAVWEAYNTLGFFWAEAAKDQITLVAYTVKGKIVKKAFEKTVKK